MVGNVVSQSDKQGGECYDIAHNVTENYHHSGTPKTVGECHIDVALALTFIVGIYQVNKSSIIFLTLPFSFNFVAT